MKAIAVLVPLAMTAMLVSVPSHASSAKYVAMGDSFSSGAGTADVYGADNGCLRTNDAFPDLWAAEHGPAAFTNLSCSGATTKAVEENQIPALAPDTTMITLTLGGDDLDFADTAKTCILLELVDRPAEQCSNALNEMIEKSKSETFRRSLAKVYTAILSAAPFAKVYVFNYPQLFNVDRFQERAISGESRKLANDVSDALSEAIQQTVQQINSPSLVFVDVRTQFAGKGIKGSRGSKNDWIAFLNTRNPHNPLHPNKAGHLLGYLPMLNKRTPEGSPR